LQTVKVLLDVERTRDAYLITKVEGAGHAALMQRNLTGNENLTHERMLVEKWFQVFLGLDF
jgi:hypothetical protein